LKTKSKIAGIVLAVIIGIVVVNAIPTILESNYYADIYRQNEEIRNAGIEPEVKDFLKKRYSELQIFKDNVGTDPIGECTWMKQNLSEFGNLIEDEFHPNEWRDLKVMITEHQKAWWDYRCSQNIEE